jgi:pimeloyl-ACP methyl ester carboxylesterase
MAHPTTQLPARETLRLTGEAYPGLALHLQAATAPAAITKLSGDLLYVHGATFGADLSVFFPFDGRSWADELSGLGLNVWALDFAGYGQSEAYSKTSDRPVGRIGDVIPQLNAAIKTIRQRNGNQPVYLVSHSWGASVAARYAATYPQDVKALVFFAPIVSRTPAASAPGAAAAATGTTPPPVVFPLSMLAQYRRFVEDVPRGQAQVLSEAHFQEWGAAYLASDKTSGERRPASVITPFGPVTDIGAMWSGQSLYDATKIVMPALLIRGAWDTLCTDADAASLISQIASVDKADVKIPKATHLMHLESGRLDLRREVNAFLKRQIN